MTVVPRECGLCFHTRKAHYDVADLFLVETPNPPCQVADCSCNGFWKLNPK